MTMSNSIRATITVLFFALTCGVVRADLDPVGQVFITFFNGEQVDETFLKETGVGNVILFRWANGLTNPHQIEMLTRQTKAIIKQTTGMMPLIAIDQEGGRVSRFREGFFQSPGNGALGKGSLANAYEVAFTMGSECHEVGINCNLAPVVDVNINPDNPVIGSRSYGNNPEIVTRFASVTIDAFHDAGLLSIIKHFPGYGDVDVNSNPHLGLPRVDKPRESLLEVELVPFRHLLNQCDGIMTAHILVPSLDPENIASCSYTILTELLRNDWGFDGVVICDSLTMRGISPNQQCLNDAIEAVGSSAVKAFNAGCDLLILGKLEWADFIPTLKEDNLFITGVMDYFRRSVEDETISQDRLDEALQRILAMKRKLDL